MDNDFWQKQNKCMQNIGWGMKNDITCDINEISGIININWLYVMWDITIKSGSEILKSNKSKWSLKISKRLNCDLILKVFMVTCGFAPNFPSKSHTSFGIWSNQWWLPKYQR